MQGAMKSRFPFFPRALGGASLLLALAGCGGGSGSSRPTLPGLTNSIAFVSTRDGGAEIYRMNPDGSRQTRVTTGLRDADNPSQSRDGRIVFQSNRDGNLEIYRVNADGSNLTRLTNDSGPATVSDSQPAFSPDGQTIAWTSERGGSANIWLMDASGENQRQFTSDARRSHSPAWMPSGQTLGFLFSAPQSAQSNISGLEIRNVATGQVTFSADNNVGSDTSHLRFNAEATQAIYSDNFQGSDVALRIYDLASKQQSRGPSVASGVGNPPSRNRAPDFGPNGPIVVWDALNNVTSTTPLTSDPAQIYRANLDGTGVTALTTQGANFSPDF